MALRQLQADYGTQNQKAVCEQIEGRNFRQYVRIGISFRVNSGEGYLSLV